jgi:hypothetical protein
MATDDSFEDFLKRNKALHAENNDFNSERRKEQWITSVSEFFGQVEKWLKPYVSQKLLEYKRKPHEISEDFVGYYMTEKMEIIVSAEILTLKPVGTLIIGSCGRIDFIGPRGIYMLIQQDWGKWYIAFRHGYSKPQYLDLTNKLFQLAIKDLITGNHEVFG